MRSNQSEKNGFRIPRGCVISRIASRPPGRRTRRSSREAGPEIGDVAHAEADGGRVEAGVRVGQREHVALDPLDRARLAPRPHEHLAREVEPRDDAALALGGDREVARAAARIEHAGAGLDDRLDREPPPAAVEPHRHDVVHDVVDRRDPVEHRPHAVRLERPALVRHWLPPARRQRLVDADLVENPGDDEVDEVVDRLRAVVEARAPRTGSPRRPRAASRARGGGSATAASRAARARACAAPSARPRRPGGSGSPSRPRPGCRPCSSSTGTRCTRRPSPSRWRTGSCSR